MKTRRFSAFIKYLGWWHIALGVQIDVRGPQIEIHFPTGFLRIGWDYYDPDMKVFEKDLVGIVG